MTDEECGRYPEWRGGRSVRGRWGCCFSCQRKISRHDVRATLREVEEYAKEAEVGIVVGGLGRRVGLLGE